MSSIRAAKTHENLIALLLTGNYLVTNANLLKLMYSENAPCISTMGSCLLSKTRGKSSIFFWKVVSWSRHPFISVKSCYWLLASCNQVPLFIASFTRAFANNLWRTISGRRKDTMWVQILIEKEKKRLPSVKVHPQIHLFRLKRVAFPHVQHCNVVIR